MEVATQDADVLAHGADVASHALVAGVTLAQAAVDAVNETISYGQFSLSADGRSLTFTQSAAYGHAEGEGSKTFDAVSFDVTDANGNATKLDVAVTIADDASLVAVGVSRIHVPVAELERHRQGVLRLGHRRIVSAEPELRNGTPVVQRDGDRFHLRGGSPRRSSQRRRRKHHSNSLVHF